MDRCLKLLGPLDVSKQKAAQRSGGSWELLFKVELRCREVLCASIVAGPGFYTPANECIE
jgi:hypothetical protein